MSTDAFIIEAHEHSERPCCLLHNVNIKQQLTRDFRFQPWRSRGSSLFWNVTQPLFDSWLPKFRDIVPNWSSRFKRSKKIRKFYNVRSTKVEKQTSLECRDWNFMIIQGIFFGMLFTNYHFVRSNYLTVYNLLKIQICVITAFISIHITLSKCNF